MVKRARHTFWKKGVSSNAPKNVVGNKKPETPVSVLSPDWRYSPKQRGVICSRLNTYKCADGQLEIPRKGFFPLRQIETKNIHI